MASGKILPATFFNRPTLEVARSLLGCRLCRRLEGDVLRWQITEVEAYDGPHDKACHAHKGRTTRTDVMFGSPGIWYIYLCYGMHWMLNIVTGPADFPAAVLIRGAGEVSGPGRLTRRMAITGGLNLKPARPDSGLWIEKGLPVLETSIKTSPRIGVDYAGADWSQRHYRFFTTP